MFVIFCKRVILRIRVFFLGYFLFGIFLIRWLLGFGFELEAYGSV